MTKEELAKIIFQSYQQGCKDTIGVIKGSIEDVEKYMESIGKNMCEKFLKNLRNYQ